MLERLVIRRHAGAVEGEAADAGFTLIELMVVLLIMAILLAIAIPTFLGVRGGANDRAAQTNLANALTTAKSYYASNQSYTGITPAAMAGSEPSLTWVASNQVIDTTNPPNTHPKNEIGVEVVNSTSNTGVGQGVLLVGWSPSNGTATCFVVADSAIAPDNTGQFVTVPMGTGTWYAQIPETGTNTTCSASNVLNDGNLKWERSWGAAGRNPST